MPSARVTLSYAGTFVESLLSLDNGARTRLKKVLSLLEADPFDAKLRTHPVKGARQPGMLSARVTDDFRLIFRLGHGLAFLLYVDRHDAAYRFAERTVLLWSADDGVHIETAASDEVERLQDEPRAGGPFSSWSDEQMVSAGVPKLAATFVRELQDVAALKASRAELGDLVSDRLLALLGEDVAEVAEVSYEPEQVDAALLSDEALLRVGVDDEQARRGIQAAQTVDELFWTLEHHGLATDRRASAVLELLCGPPSYVDKDVSAEKAAGRESPFETIDDVTGFDDLLEAVKLRHHQFRTWQLYLTRSQRALVERHYDKPVRISGPPGTGKTVLAIHRAHWLTKLAEREGRLTSGSREQVYVVVFNQALKAAIASQVGQLTAGSKRFHHITVKTLHELAGDIAGARVNKKLADLSWDRAFTEWKGEHATPALERLGQSYLRDEIAELVKGRGIERLDDYLALERRGRVFRLGRKDREAVWALYESYQHGLAQQPTLDYPDLVNQALARLRDWPLKAHVLGVVVDEVQDLSPQALRLLNALAGAGANRLFLTGDSCQSIYQQSFSLAEVGIDVGGTGRRLRTNYRNSKLIWKAALSVLQDTPYDDWVGQRGDLQSVHARGFAGEVSLTPVSSRGEERTHVAQRIAALVEEGVPARDIAVLVRRNDQGSGYPKELATHDVEARQARERKDAVCVGTMHATKGMEFRHVFLIGLSDDVMPLLNYAPSEESERARVIDLERRLLFTAMTRARDGLHLSWDQQPSRFLSRLLAEQQKPALV